MRFAARMLFSLLTILSLSANQVCAKVSMIESRIDGFRFSYDPGDAMPDTLRVGGKTYLLFTAEGHSYAAQPGEPQIPFEQIYFAAPSGTRPGIELTGLETSTFEHVRIAPAPSMEADPDGYDNPVYLEDPSLYAMSGFQPSVFAGLERVSDTGEGMAIWRLTLSPVLFDAFRNTVSRARRFECSVTFNGSFPVVSGNTRVPSYLVNYATVQQQARGVSALKQAADQADPFASGEWYRLALTESGMYSITGAELAKAGFAAGTVASNAIHMFYGGGRMLGFQPIEPSTDAFREISVKIIDGGDGKIDADDRIIFYGEALSRFIPVMGAVALRYQNYLYADTGENVYWLKIDSSSAPKPMAPKGETLSGGISVMTSYREVIHLEPENTIEFVDPFGAESGLDWFWVAVGTQTVSLTFDAPGCTDPASAVIRLGFRNGLIHENEPSLRKYTIHSLNASVNHSSFQNFQIRTVEDSTVSVEIPVTAPVQQTGNVLELYRAPDIDDASHARLDWLEVEYSRELKPGAEGCEFFQLGTGSPAQFSMKEVPSSSTELYDTTDPYNVGQVSAQYNGQNHTLNFQVTIGTGVYARFAAAGPSQYRTVTAVTRKAPINLRSPSNSADYIIITHKDFRAEAVTLANWRAHDSSIDPLATMVVDVADVYDEFSWGVFDPAAIRDFLHYAWHTYNQGAGPVRYCCLFGDTTYKYKNIQNQPEKNYLPTFTGYIKNDDSFDQDSVITDDFFSWFDTPEVPEIAIGRMCFADAQTARAVVAKTIAYERDPAPGEWHNRILLSADDEYVFGGAVVDFTNFTADLEDIETNSIPPSFECKKLLLIEHPMVNKKKPSVTAELFKDINEGYLIFNFIGHGNNDVLAHEDILRGSRDMDKFENGAKLPVFIALSCTVGQFDRPGITSLAESLQLRATGGSIASISSGRYTYNLPNVEFGKSFYDSLFTSRENPDKRIGCAVLKSKQIHADDNNAYKYFLFGDPATRLMMPRQKITVPAIDTLRRLERIDISGLIEQGPGQIGNVNIEVKAYGPKQHKLYKTLLVEIAYTQPGNLFYRGTLAVNDPAFSFSCIVPKDTESDIAEPWQNQQESKIIFYAEGDGLEASGVADGFFIGDIDPNAPVDTSGPEYTLSFDGKKFEAGDVIRREPELTLELSDPSGINIVGTRGHTIKLLLDRTESYDLTDSYSCENGFTSGKLTYRLPQLSVGKHAIEISADDSYNNVSKISLDAEVAGSETGDIAIQNLLNYPNPMATQGTTFTFNLTDFAQKAVIRIYSQAGRLVDTLKFTAGYGYNQVFWKPPLELANGVYFYKLSVTSANGRSSSKIEKLVVMR